MLSDAVARVVAEWQCPPPPLAASWCFLLQIPPTVLGSGDIVRVVGTTLGSQHSLTRVGSVMLKAERHVGGMDICRWIYHVNKGRVALEKR